MAPNSTFDLPLVGRLIPQTSDDGLATVSQVFTDFIHGKSSQVTVLGDFAGPDGVSAACALGVLYLILPLGFMAQRWHQSAVHQHYFACPGCSGCHQVY